MSLMAELGVDAPPPAKKPAPNLPVSSLTNWMLHLSNLN